MPKKQGFAVWKLRDKEGFEKHQRLAVQRRNENLARVYNPIKGIIIEHFSNKPEEFILSECRKIKSDIKWHSIQKFASDLKIRRKVYYHKSREKDIIMPNPSKGFAWFLGVLAGDGCVVQNRVVLAVCDNKFRNKFAEIGNNLFKLKPGLKNNLLKNYKNGIRYEAVFSSNKLMP